MRTNAQVPQQASANPDSAASATVLRAAPPGVTMPKAEPPDDLVMMQRIIKGSTAAGPPVIQRQTKTDWNDPAQSSARTWHQMDLNHVETALQLMANGKGVHATNTVEYIRKGKLKIQVYTKTHDAEARAQAMGFTGKVAWFGEGVAWPTDCDYDADDLKSMRNIGFYPEGYAGRAGGGVLKLFEPSKLPMEGPDGLIPTLVHELQHLLDHHQDAQDPWERYKTEFRAFWVDGTFKAFSPTAPAITLAVKDGPPLEGFLNLKQVEIAKQLMDGAGGPRVAAAWKSDAAFRQKVKAYATPEGFNLVNSLRIEALYQVVSKPSTVEEVKAESANLSADDRQFLQNPAMKTPWIELIDGKYSAADAGVIKGELGFGGSTPR